MKTLSLFSLTALVVGCAANEPSTDDNPFTKNLDNDGKEDSAYLNPDGTEVEIDLEGDVQGPAYKLADAPGTIGQFATSYFRKKQKMYIESVAEGSSAKDIAEWLSGR